MGGVNDDEMPPRLIVLAKLFSRREADGECQWYTGPGNPEHTPGPPAFRYDAEEARYPICAAHAAVTRARYEASGKTAPIVPMERK